MNNLKIAIGADHAGFELKNALVEHLNYKDIKVEDFGCYSGEKVDYPVIAKDIARKVAEGEFDKGIIVCGSGIGVAIAANKIKGIRAVVCHDLYSARMSRTHNDANVLALGGRIIAPELACEIVNLWLQTGFEGGRHKLRVDMID